MKTKLILSLAIGMSLQASNSHELRSVVEGNTTSYEPISALNSKPQVGACRYPPVPCWGESCQSSYPDNCLTKYNRAQEKQFRKVFPEGGPWDMPGNPIKKCLVNYMRNTTPYNCTTATAVPATALAVTLVGAYVGSVSMYIGECCCGCSNDCGTTGHNACSHFITEICCPFGCNGHHALCCPPNIYNILTMVAETACMALPFACFGLESCCISHLADPNTWTDSTETSYQSISQQDEETN